MSEKLSQQQTTEQLRAKSAWKNVSGLTGQSHCEKYGRQARHLAMLIQVNGLGQTVAFCKSKSTGKGDAAAGFRDIYQHLSAWVTHEVDGQASDLLQRFTEWDSDTYRRATVEALAYALWLRRFVEGMGWGKEEDD
jgi:CRISPR-associated protein Cmr5